MNINLDNYESFFLMYVDNELSAAERVCVETFIQENPSLADELAIFKSMVLPVEGSQMADKSLLYRSEAMDFNMQEAMLLKLDNELPAEASKALMDKIAADESMEAGWKMLQRTRLDATEKILFPHKQSLYRKETGGKLVYARFTKWAVAAALVAAGFFAGVAIVNNGSDEIETGIATVTDKNAIDKTIRPAKPVDSTQPMKQNGQVGIGEESISNSATIVEEPSLAENKATNREKAPGIAPAKSVEIAKQSNTESKPDANRVVNNRSSLASASENLKIKSPEREEAPTLLAAVSDRPKTTVENVDRNMTETESTYARSTLMEELEPNDNHILFLDEADVARSKAGIFLKKLKRTVTRTTNIKTGNSLKIAGFEFAVK